MQGGTNHEIWHHAAPRVHGPIGELQSAAAVREIAVAAEQAGGSGILAHMPVMRCADSPFACVIKFGAWQLSSTSMSDIDSSARSPCIRNCCLDDALTCLGCFRSLEEIKEWGLVDDHRRRIILQNARQRREAYEVSERSDPYGKKTAGFRYRP